MQNKKEPWIFVKILSKHRQVISSKFPRSFRDARDLVVFYDWFYVFSEVLLDFQKFTKHHQDTSTPKNLRKLA